MLHALLDLLPGEAPARQEVRRAVDYFTEHAERMRYPEFAAAGWPLGSGMAESACKLVVQAREKQAGMRWHRSGAQAVATLRALQPSGRWDEFWTRQPQLRRPPAHNLSVAGVSAA